MSGMNPDVFLQRCEGIVTGMGFKRVLQGVDINALRDATGMILTGATAPLKAALETNFFGVQSATSTTAGGTLSFAVPEDYDQDQDYMSVRFLCNSAGTTDAPTIDATLYQKVAGTAISSDLNPTISAAASKTSATTGAGWIEIVAKGLGLKAGAAVTWLFTISAHATNALNIYAIEVVYKSDLVFYNRDSR